MRDLNVVQEGLPSDSDTWGDLAAASQDLAAPIVQILALDLDVSA